MLLRSRVTFRRLRKSKISHDCESRGCGCLWYHIAAGIERHEGGLKIPGHVFSVGFWDTIESGSSSRLRVRPVELFPFAAEICARCWLEISA